MQFLSRLKIDGLNQRAFDETDFFRICEEEGITVLERNVETSFYLCVLERPVIVLKKRLRGLRRRFAMFHELGHHFCHAGAPASPQAFFYGLLDSRHEREADVFALVALLPAPALRDFDFLEDNPEPYARHLLADRLRLRFLYGV